MHSLTGNESTTRTRVHGALAALPEDDRVLIERIYWSGLPAAEVATELGIPPELAKARLRSALGRLAELLAD
jgi:RNA polymerase sigma-70 factor (ECF subfamily)